MHNFDSFLMSTESEAVCYGESLEAGN